mgnify:CR=1 FL=1
MANMIETVERKAFGVAVDAALKNLNKDREKGLLQIIDLAQRFMGDNFKPEAYEGAKKIVQNPDHKWMKFVNTMLDELDPNVAKMTALNLGFEAAFYGTKTIRKMREVHHCNIPWLILMDPTSACNMNCKGCWAAEYGHKLNLTYDEINNVINQGVELGTHLYMFTGGEPLIRKNDILRLCREHKNCTFLAYTNATLIDQKFCDDMKDVGNLTLALSIEGSEESNDFRRGKGAYERTIKAMELLKKNKCIYGLSICYTSQNVDKVTSDEFIDLMIEKGAKFALYFNYMPVGTGAVEELIPTPEQRTHMYFWLKKMRNGKTGKPLFVMDFQDDGEYVGGCIAGGRNYFHINSAGDIEPCVFIHFSDSNIRTHTILEALRNPLFMSYYHNQPFNDNHLRPCPMLENPEYLRKMIKQTGAKSTDLENQEGVEHLCAKCDKFAAAWKEQADKLWTENKHPNPKTQYYRDTEQAMKEKLDDLVR